LGDTPALEPERVRAFSNLLARHPRRRIDRTTLWRAFAKAFPHRPQGREEREWFVAALSAVAATGVIRFPAPGGQRWDRGSEPAVPTAVDRSDQRDARARGDEWRRFPWHPELAWVADLPRLSADTESFLRRVHDGLVHCLFTQPAPLKYRSLQLTGDEKRLGFLVKTMLFAPGRLSFQLLGCLPGRAPLAWAKVGDCDAALIVENAGPFNVAVSVLRSLSSPPYGVVVYGGGGGIEHTLLGIREIGFPVSRLMYLGDLDRPGLRIAQAAARVAAASNLPPVEPAVGLHERMLEAAASLGHPNGWETRSRRARVDDAQLVSWLPTAIRPRVLSILASNRRVPEEVLGPKELMTAWAT